MDNNNLNQKESHVPEMDAPANPLSNTENKLVPSLTIGIVLMLALVACIPIFNFILAPILGIGAIIMYLIYSISKRSVTTPPLKKDKVEPTSYEKDRFINQTKPEPTSSRGSYQSKSDSNQL